MPLRRVSTPPAGPPAQSHIRRVTPGHPGRSSRAAQTFHGRSCTADDAPTGRPVIHTRIEAHCSKQFRYRPRRIRRRAPRNITTPPAWLPKPDCRPASVHLPKRRRKRRPHRGTAKHSVVPSGGFDREINGNVKNANAGQTAHRGQPRLSTEDTSQAGVAPRR